VWLAVAAREQQCSTYQGCARGRPAASSAESVPFDTERGKAVGRRKEVSNTVNNTIQSAIQSAKRSAKKGPRKTGFFLSVNLQPKE
jgi:hypothetical protein